MDSRRRWTVVLLLFIMGNGMVTQLRGVLLPNFQQTFDIPEHLLGFVAPAGTVGLVVAVLIIGMLSGRLDLRQAILFGTGGTTICLLLASSADSYVFLLFIFLIQGATIGVVRAVDRPLLGHLYPDKRGRVFNLYALMWALGATIAPLIANAALAVGQWRLTYLLLSGLFLVVALLVTRLKRPGVAQAEQSLSWDSLLKMLRLSSVRGMTVALIASGAIEGTIFTWLPYYANQFFPQSTSNILLSGYLVMYIPGRLSYGFLADRFRSLELVLLLALVSLPVAAVAFIGGSTIGLVSGVLGLGLLVSGFFPTLSAFGVGTAPQYSGPINAIATAANFVGLSIAPVVVGIVATRYTIQTGMQLLLLILGCLVLVVAITRIHFTHFKSTLTGGESEG